MFDNGNNINYEFDYFVSYCHKDNEPVDSNIPESGFITQFIEKIRTAQDFKKMFGGKGPRIFFDTTEIRAMTQWDERIRTALNKSKFLLVFLSPNYFQSGYCAREFQWWSDHEMHRAIFEETVATMYIVNINGYPGDENTIPTYVPDNLHRTYPSWVKVVSGYQHFDLHDLMIDRIDETVRELHRETTEKLKKMDAPSPLGDLYPSYNIHFVGRRQELHDLRRSLTPVKKNTVVTANGLAGLGKTELALTYGHAFAWDYRLGRFFIPCENEVSLSKVLLSAGIDKMHGIEIPKEGNENERCKALFSILKNLLITDENLNGPRILIILDNLNKPELVECDLFRDFLNNQERFNFIHFIVTTRLAANQFSNAHTLAVGKLSPSDSRSLLESFRPFQNTKNQAEMGAANDIADLLDGFTLALELTGAFLKNHTTITYQAYLHYLKTQAPELWEMIAKPGQTLDLGQYQFRQEKCLSVIFTKSFESLTLLQQTILKICAFFPPDFVPLGWMKNLVEGITPELLPDKSNTLFAENRIPEAIETLVSMGFLTKNESEPNIGSIHRLLSDTLKSLPRLKTDVEREIYTLFGQVLDKDEERWQKDSSNDWELTAIGQYSITDFAKTDERKKSDNNVKENQMAEFLPLWSCLNKLGCIEVHRGNYLTSQKMFDATTNFTRLFCTEKNKKIENQELYSQLANDLINLGNSHYRNGHNEEAEREYDEALEIYRELVEQNPGAYWPDVAKTLNNLGILHSKNGHNEEAKRKYDEALKIYRKLERKSPGVYRPDVAGTLNNLGILHKNNDRYKEAECKYSKALKIYRELTEQNSGAYLPYVAATLNNLGNLHKNNGRYEEAEREYDEALEIRRELVEQNPGAYRPDVAGTLNNLGILHKNNDRYKEAECEYDEALEIRRELAEQNPGAYRPYVATTLNNLGILHSDDDRYEEAEREYDEALEIYRELVEQNPGAYWPDVAKTLNNLGILHSDNDRYEEAEREYDEALEIYRELAEQNPGAYRPYVAGTLNNLGILYSDNGRNEEAEREFDDALEIYQELVPQNPDAHLKYYINLLDSMEHHYTTTKESE